MTGHRPPEYDPARIPDDGTNFWEELALELTSDGHNERRRYYERTRTGRTRAAVADSHRVTGAAAARHRYLPLHDRSTVRVAREVDSRRGRGARREPDDPACLAEGSRQGRAD